VNNLQKRKKRRKKKEKRKWRNSCATSQKKREKEKKKILEINSASFNGAIKTIKLSRGQALQCTAIWSIQRERRRKLTLSIMEIWLG